LRAETKAGPYKGFGGAFAWGIQWKVSAGANRKLKGGVIIQKLTVSWQVTDIDLFNPQPVDVYLFSPELKGLTLSAKKSPQVYYELWKVDANGKVTPLMNPGLSPDALKLLKQDGVTIPKPGGLRINDWYAALDFGRGLG